ncbi:MAG: exo-alpha-sialidase [Gemmatimonadaceae bacterium]
MNPRLIAVIVLTAIGCAPSEVRTPPQVTALPSPVGPRSAEPYLFVDASDRVHMTWIQRTSDSTHAVRYARMEGEAWTPASTIVERRDLFVNWADFPAVIATARGRVFAHWLQRSGTGTYAYDVHVAQSTDHGTTWGPSTVLHRDGKSAEHGFVALWEGNGDSVNAAWLDGRTTVSSQKGHGKGAMTVHTTSVAPDGSLGSELLLDERTCECCQVNAALTSAGPVVVYRDRTEDEVRDISIVRLVNGAWTAPAAVAADGWQLNACPVNGPAVAARADTVVVAWFTGAQDTARVRVAWSTDAGATFAPSMRIDTGTPVGRVDVELLDDGSAAVSWLERVPPDRGDVRVRRVARSGTLGEPFTIVTTSAARPAGFPKLVRRGPDLIAAWTVPGEEATVRLGRLPAKDLP